MNALEQLIQRHIEAKAAAAAEEAAERDAKDKEYETAAERAFRLWLDEHRELCALLRLESDSLVARMKGDYWCRVSIVGEITLSGVRGQTMLSSDYNPQGRVAPFRVRVIWPVDYIEFELDNKDDDMIERVVLELTRQCPYISRLKVKLDNAARVLEIARQYQAALYEYEEECRQWATTWTEKLWRPWNAWRIRYAPVGGRRDDDDYDVEVTLDYPLGVGAQIQAIDFSSGRMRTVVFGVFLDATPIEYNESSIEHTLDHHRHSPAGRYYVNVPPYITEDPAPAPESPGTFVGFVKSVDPSLNAPNLAYYDTSLVELLKMSAEDYVLRFDR